MNGFSDEAKVFASQEIRKNPGVVDGLGAWDRWHEMAAGFDALVAAEAAAAVSAALVA